MLAGESNLFGRGQQNLEAHTGRDRQAHVGRCSREMLLAFVFSKVSAVCFLFLV
jgi:hypothetical protein